MMSGGRFTIESVKPEWSGSKAPHLILTSQLERNLNSVYRVIKKDKLITKTRNLESAKFSFFVFSHFRLS